MNRRLYSLFVCALLFFAACGGDNPPAPAASRTDIQGNPKISITSPKDGDEVEFLNAKIEVEVSGFALENKMGLENVGGEGHIIYYAWNGFGEDGTTYAVPTTPGQPANSGGTGYVAVASAEKGYDWGAFLQNGRQIWAAQLVNNDNTPLEPPQVAKVIVEVTGEKPKETPKDNDDEKGPNG